MDPEAQRLVVWMLSDIQPLAAEGRRDFETAVEDVRANIPEVDLAVIAGDLLESGATTNDFDWFLAARARAGVPHWFELAGNHDIRNRQLFQRYFPGPEPCAAEIGNLRLLLMSDETTDSPTVISGPAFEWWRRQVVEHPGEILLTVTHAPLRRSGILLAGLGSRCITDSERFEEVLRNHRVAVWASGHLHLPHGLPRASYVNRRLGGTCFLNVSAIRAARFKDSQSRILIFTEGSRTLRIRSRNHGAGRYNPRLDIVLTLDRAFRGAADAPVLTAAGDEPPPPDPVSPE